LTNRATNDSPQSPVQREGLNDLALTPDGEYLIASVLNRSSAGNGRLLRIDLRTGSLQNIELLGSAEAIAGFSGSQGMNFYNDELIMINAFPATGAIYSAAFSNSYTEAALDLRFNFTSDFNVPTSWTIVGDRFWVVNSQFDRVIF
jgi:hypothetical protein